MASSYNSTAVRLYGNTFVSTRAVRLNRDTKQLTSVSVFDAIIAQCPRHLESTIGAQVHHKGTMIEISTMNDDFKQFLMGTGLHFFHQQVTFRPLLGTRINISNVPLDSEQIDIIALVRHMEWDVPNLHVGSPNIVETLMEVPSVHNKSGKKFRCGKWVVYSDEFIHDDRAVAIFWGNRVMPFRINSTAPFREKDLETYDTHPRRSDTTNNHGTRKEDKGSIAPQKPSSTLSTKPDERHNSDNTKSSSIRSKTQRNQKNQTTPTAKQKSQEDKRHSDTKREGTTADPHKNSYQEPASAATTVSPSLMETSI